MRTYYNLHIAKRPPFDPATGKCAPEDVPALRRYQAVTKAMRHHGITEEEAVAIYDRPRGKCSKCGADTGSLGRKCYGCMLDSQREKQTAYRTAKRGLKPRTCKAEGCEAQFIAIRFRYCVMHRKQTVVRPPKEPKTIKAAPPSRPVLPPNWEEPTPAAALAHKRYMEHVGRKEPAKVAEVIINPGVPVTIYPPLPGRWESMAGELADFDPVRARVVEQVIERRAR